MTSIAKESAPFLIEEAVNNVRWITLNRPE